jgi:hypothetical protein
LTLFIVEAAALQWRGHRYSIKGAVLAEKVRAVGDITAFA